MQGVNMVLKLLLVGDTRVGKSCMLQKFLGTDDDASIFATTLPTNGVDFASCIAQLRDPITGAHVPVKLHVWDTSGQEQFRTITESYYRNAHGAICAFDMSNRASFRSVSMWILRLAQISPGTQCLLVGIAGPGHKLDKTRSVTREEGEACAERFHVNFMEVESRYDTELAFINIAQECFTADVLQHPVVAAASAASAASAAATTALLQGQTDDTQCCCQIS